MLEGNNDEISSLAELFYWHDIIEVKNANEYCDRTNAGFT
jgi:hypothetical protein